MRPISISLEGFFAYRQPTELDLESVDYFSLTGPTGAGKSSLIDAMVFALYGRVPRLGGRDVASAISAGSDRARVSFLFRADDRTYTVTRLLQRTKSGGATTKEARLESEGLEPTSGAGDVTAAVSELLRLNFDDFTRTVVLPQGEFARFLQASPGERQEILRNLLGLDIYRRVGERARRLADNANSEVDSATGLLEGLGVPTDDQIGEAIVQRTKIDQLVVDVAKLESKLEEKVAGVKSLEADMARGEDAIFRLDDLAPPEHLGETGQLIQQAEQAIEDHRSRLESVNETIEEIESALSEMADKTTIERLSALYGRLDRVESSLASNEARTAKEKLDQAESDLAAASEGLETAKSEYEAVRARHAATRPAASS